MASRKILIISIAHDLAVVTDACRDSVGKLGNCAQNHRRARAAGPEYRAQGGEAGCICVTNHVSRTIDGVTGENAKAANEYGTRCSQRKRSTRAVCPGQG